MGNMLYLECATGISGDMFAAALLDLGADEAALYRALSSLPLDGYEINISRVKKCGLDMCDFDVHKTDGHGGHDHDMEYLYGHSEYPKSLGGVKNTPLSDSDKLSGDAAAGGHDHDMEYLHGHGEREHPGHTHDHTEHRNTKEIRQIILGADMTKRAKDAALKILDILADAEAKAHGVAPDEVHFHEAGAADSIADIVAAAVCLDSLNITDVIIPFLCEGTGTVRCRHGILPVPVPAVTNIVLAHRLPLHITNLFGERVTPTGAAIAAAARTKDRLPEHFIIEKTGMGEGKREYETPSFLRAMLITEQTFDLPENISESGVISPLNISPATGSVKKSDSGKLSGGIIKSDIGRLSGGIIKSDSGRQSGYITNSGSCPAADCSDRSDSDSIIKSDNIIKSKNNPSADGGVRSDSIIKIETNIDDCDGETLGYTLERLMSAGAKDVYYTPVFMKKNRPAYLLTVLCDEENIPELEEIIFNETTTTGLRKIRADRTVLPRESEEIELSAGRLKVKKCTLPDGTVRIYPEYESAAALARDNGIPLKDIWKMFNREALNDFRHNE